MVITLIAHIDTLNLPSSTDSSRYLWPIVWLQCNVMHCVGVGVCVGVWVGCVLLHEFSKWSGRTCESLMAGAVHTGCHDDSSLFLRYVRNELFFTGNFWCWLSELSPTWVRDLSRSGTSSASMDNIPSGWGTLQVQLFIVSNSQFH